MSKKVLVFEDIIPKASLKEMQEFFFSTNFPVFLETTSCVIVGGEKDLFPNKTTYDNPQFSHVFINNYKENSPFTQTPIDVLLNFQKKLGVTKVNVERCKYNITLARPDINGLHLMPHIDSYVENAYTAIFYVNDSDGDTLFFEGEDVIFRMSPKENTMVLFPNNLVHCAELSKKTPFRAVLNYNFSLGEDEKFSFNETTH